jgi:hypothetical protein
MAKSHAKGPTTLPCRCPSHLYKQQLFSCLTLTKVKQEVSTEWQIHIEDFSVSKP